MDVARIEAPQRLGIVGWASREGNLLLIRSDVDYKWPSSAGVFVAAGPTATTVAARWVASCDRMKIGRPDAIDGHYERALEAGALGGKLLGAGSGGFLLFFCEPHCQDRVRSALPNLQEVSFALEPSGAKVIYVGESQW